MKIIISGDYAYASNTEKEGVRLDMAMSRLQRTDTGDEIIPDGVRFIRGKRLIFELEPGVRNVDMAWNDDDWTYSCRLAFPYIIFYYRYDRYGQDPVYVFFRNKPLRSLDDELYVPALPNCLGGGLGGTGMYYACGTEGGGDLSWLAHKLRTEFFEQQFNKDGYSASGHAHYIRSLKGFKRRFCKIRDPAAWERASLKDPNFILKMDWRETKHTPRSLLTTYRTNPGTILGQMHTTIWKT